MNNVFKIVVDCRVDKVIQFKTAVVNKLLKLASTTEEKEYVLEQIYKNDLLPICDYICDACNIVTEYLEHSGYDDYISRHEKIIFHRYIDDIYKYRKNLGEEVNRDEIVNQIFNWVKENRYIGTEYDW